MAAPCTPVVVGFDLDMTLIDTRPGLAAVLARLGPELGVDLPVDEIGARIGPPLNQLLAPYLPPELVGPAGDRFRELYPGLAIDPVPALPGAAAALAAVRRRGGRTVVVTGKFPANARLHVVHLGLDVDVVEGWVWGAAKGEVLRREGASVYVGDHVHDVAGARAGGATSVSVLGGGSSREDLLDAGTDVVLETLHDFPSWLAAHVA